MNEVTVSQKNHILYLAFNTPTKNINCLYLRNEFFEMKYDPVNDSQTFEFDLMEAADAFGSYHQDKVFLIIEKTNGILINQEKLNVKKYNAHILNLKEIERYDTNFYPYITANGILQLSFIEALPVNTYLYRRHIDKIQIKHNTVFIRGKFATINSHLENASVIITSRLSNSEKVVPLSTAFHLTNKKRNTTTYKFTAHLGEALTEYMDQKFDSEDVIDLFLEMKVQEFATPLRMKLGNPRILAENSLKGEVIRNFEDRVITLTPYFTLKGRNLSFTINALTQASFKTYKACLKKRKLPLSIHKNKIWVIGEKYYKAQDNGFHFFTYMRTHHPDKQVYYILDKNSNEYENVAPYGNVIDYQSPEHFRIMLQADYICTTHDPELIFPTNNYQYAKKVKAKRIFLQHGVLGVKNLTQINGKQLKDFHVDLFITSSDRERQIVERDLKYDSYQVPVTGLPRFDQLFKEDVQVKDQILIIPTWRDWLTKKENLMNSEYLERMNNLLNSSAIKHLTDQNISVVFCLHPNMQPFIDLFDVPSYIRSIKQGDENVQQLLKESRLMITDYSSVAFDFSFLNRPVIYYQFDKNRFLGKYPSHLDIENELPGTIVHNQPDLEKALQQFYEAQFVINETLKERISVFNPYQDLESSKRIYEAIINFKRRNKLKDLMKFHILSQHLYNRFTNSKRYYKVMSWYNKLLTLFARRDKNLIVFESNVGKSVSDSPKFIYDEVKRRGLNYKIVWVNNSIHPFNDPNVVSVERLSPSYFTYLSKADFWVNNQNFPYYIDKKKDTTYIQTWHGTPLKKMLNDVEEFAGRDKGYKQRVNISTSKWDYLISPSPYATRCFQSAFQFSGEMLEVGYPRNDIFYHQTGLIQDKKQLVKQRLGIPGHKQVMLYAPTFRDDEVSAAKKHTINLQLDLHYMKEQLGSEYVLLLRPHIIVSNALNIDPSLDDFVVNVAQYNEMSDLFLISDICITDYSSVMFDFANTGKPMVFFAYDFEHYKNNLRGFYMDFEEEVPGPIVYNNEQLIDALKDIEEIEKDYAEKYERFYDNYCTFETGKSAQLVVDQLLKP